MKKTHSALQGSALFAGFAVLMANGSSFGATADTQTEVQDVPVLSEITIASHLIGVPYDSSGVSSTIINPRELEEQGLTTLSQGLARVPGVYVLDGGSTNQRGSSGQVKIRGMNKETYALLMVDGMRISDVNRSGDAMFGLTNMFTTGHIEVVKGSQGAVYGSGAVGGVVGMMTPEGEGDPSWRIFSEVGSNGSYTGYTVAQGVVNKLSYFVGVGFETTENDPDYVCERNFINSPSGKNDFHQFQEALKLGYALNDKVKFNVTYRRVDADAENPEYDPVYNGYGTDMIYTTKDKHRSNLVTGSVDAELTKIWATSFMTGFYDYHYNQRMNVDSKYPYEPFNQDHSKVQLEWRNQLKFNDQFKTVVGMAWDRTQYDTTYTNDQLESIYGFFAEQFWSPVESLDFSFAARLDHSTVWGDQFTWRYANSWKVTGKDSPTRLFGSVGSGFRAPTYFERYGCYSSGWAPTVGNPDLSISRSLGGDIGIEQRLYKQHYATVTGFWTRINNQIGTATVDNEFGYADHYTFKNYSYATSAGVETALRGDFNDAWETGYTFAYTYTLPKSDEGHQLESTARHTISADIHTSPIENVTTGVGIVAGLNRTNWDSSRLDDFITLRWYARWQVTKNLSLHIRVENICNEKYAIQRSYNNVQSLAWGTAVMGGLTLDF